MVPTWFNKIPMACFNVILSKLFLLIYWGYSKKNCTLNSPEKSWNQETREIKSTTNVQCVNNTLKKVTCFVCTNYSDVQNLLRGWSGGQRGKLVNKKKCLVEDPDEVVKSDSSTNTRSWFAETYNCFQKRRFRTAFVTSRRKHKCILSHENSEA